MSELPEGWKSASLRELVGHDGVLTDGDWIESKDQDPNGNVRLIQLADVGDGRYVNKSSRFMTADKAMDLDCTYLKEGDVLVSRMADPLGRACIFPGDSKPSVTVVDVCIIRTGKWGVDHGWLSHAINSPQFREDATLAASGTTRSRISRSNLAELHLQVPPLPEQRRIVSKIESLTARSRRAKEALDAIPKLLEQFRQSVLASAFRGDLTAAWRAKNPDVEPADVLLKRIRIERRKRWEEAELAKMRAKGKAPADDKWKAKYEEPAPVDTSELPELPEGWAWASVDELTTTMTSGSRAWSPYYDRGTGTFIMAQNVRPWHPDFSTRQAVDPPLSDPERARTAVIKGDLLITIVGANTGDVCSVETDLPDTYVCQSVALLRPVFIDSSPYLVAYFNSASNGQRFLNDAMYGQGRPHLSFEQLRSIPVVVLPQAEMKEVVGTIGRWIQRFDVLNSTSDGIKQAFVDLNRSILSKAFRGELVPQDPADEPASLLLDRIRREAATHGPPKPKRGRNAKTSQTTLKMDDK